MQNVNPQKNIFNTSVLYKDVRNTSKSNHTSHIFSTPKKIFKSNLYCFLFAFFIAFAENETLNVLNATVTSDVPITKLGLQNYVENLIL